MKINSLHRAGLATILLENLTDPFGLVVGRADKRYTLWKYNRTETDGVPCLTIAYIQVLSDKRHRVEQRFPGIFICEELRGEHRLVIEGRIRGKNGKLKPVGSPRTAEDFLNMPFGSFSGMNLREASDWKWCKIANEYTSLTWTDAWGDEFDFTDLVMERLAEFKCEKVAGKWYTESQLENPKLWMYLANTCDRTANPEAYEEYSELCRQHGMQKLAGRWFPFVPFDDEKPWMAVARQILPLIEDGKEFSFVPSFNGNGFWFGIAIVFRPEDIETVSTYYGTSRFIKVTDKKGIRRNKRVKGKTITIHEYEILTNEVDNQPYLLVNKYSIS